MEETVDWRSSRVRCVVGRRSLGSRLSALGSRLSVRLIRSIDRPTDAWNMDSSLSVFRCCSTACPTCE